MKTVLTKNESNKLIKYGANPEDATGPDNCFTLDDILDKVIVKSCVHWRRTHNLQIEYNRRKKNWDVLYTPYLTDYNSRGSMIYTRCKELINALVEIYIQTYNLRTNDSHFRY